MKKNKSVLMVCLTFAAFWVISNATNASATIYPASDYVSLYDFPKTYYYTSSAGATGQPSVRTGYRYQYDLSDPIIGCGRETGTCSMPEKYSQINRVVGELSRFKVYIAPGTTGIDLSIYLSGQSSRYVAVARLGQPPQTDDGYIRSLSDQDFIGKWTGGFQLDALRNDDCIGSNNAGILLIAAGGVAVSREDEGGWLYVLLVPRAGNVSETIYNNQVNTRQFMTWFQNVDWAAFGSAGSIYNPNPTPTPTPGTTPTPTPTPTSGSDCGVFGCNQNETCVNKVCVPNSTNPTPTPTPTAGGCSELACLFQGGKCVNNVCVPKSTTPTPTPTPTPKPTATPTPTPTPTPVSLTFEAKPLSQFVIERKQCTNIDLSSMIPALTSSSPPSGNVTFYSALFISDANATMFFAQKDILQKEAFIYYAVGDPIKGHSTGVFPTDGLWQDNAFKTLFGGLTDVTCASLADSGISFLFGYAPNGDLSQFHGAAFTFVKTP